MIVHKFTLLKTRPVETLGRLLLYPEVRMTSNLDFDARLTVAEAAAYFQLSKAHVNKWYIDGHLTDVTANNKGHRLYLLSELLEAEYQTRRHPNSRRRPQLLAPA